MRANGRMIHQSTLYHSAKGIPFIPHDKYYTYKMHTWHTLCDTHTPRICRFTLNRVSVLSHCCVLLIRCLRWKRTKNARYALLSKVNRQMYTCANQIQQHYITNNRVHTNTITIAHNIQYTYIYILYMLAATGAHIHINILSKRGRRTQASTYMGRAI